MRSVFSYFTSYLTLALLLTALCLSGPHLLLLLLSGVSPCRWHQDLHMQWWVWFTFQLHVCRHMCVCVFAFMRGLLTLCMVFLLKVRVILRTVCSGRALRSWLGRWVCMCVCVCVFVCVCVCHRWDHRMTAVGAWMSPQGELSRRRHTSARTKTWQVCSPSLLSALALAAGRWRGNTALTQVTKHCTSSQQERDEESFFLKEGRKHAIPADPPCSPVQTAN